MAHTLEARREKIRKLIDLATEDSNPVKIWQGYYLLTEINRRLSHAYSLENKFSNLYK